MLSRTIEQDFNEVKNTWIKCIDDIFQDDSLHVDDVTLKRLERASTNLTRTANYSMGMLQVLMSELQLTVIEYASQLISPKISILVNFQEFLYRFKDEILPSFKISDQLLTEISKSVEESFYYNLTLKYDTILKQIISEVLTCTAEEIDVTLKFCTNTLFETMTYKGIETNKAKVIISKSLESAVKQILKESEGRNDFIEFLMRFQIVINLIFENFDIKNKELHSLMQLCFGSNIENSLKLLLELQNNTKMKTTTLESINHYCRSHQISDEKFISLLLKYRPIEYTKDDLNGLLNRIDLVDTFEENPMKRLVNIYRDTHDKTCSNLHIADHHMVNSTIHGDESIEKYCSVANFSTNSKAVDTYKRILRETFRESVQNIRRFHESLSTVIDSYLETVQKNDRLTGNNINFDQTMYALLMLIINYTPDLKVFISEYYVPRLLKRLMFSQGGFFDKTVKSDNFENILISMLPRETRHILTALIQKYIAEIQKPVYIDSVNCNFNGIFLQGSDYSFTLPKSEPIFPNSKFKDTWYANIMSVEKGQWGKKFDQNMHVAKMTSPFLTASDEQVELILPMNAASILYCFNESDTLDIHDIKDKLKITKNQEIQLVRSLKLLMKYGLILKKGASFSVRLSPIHPELLDGDNILRLI